MIARSEVAEVYEAVSLDGPKVALKCLPPTREAEEILKVAEALRGTTLPNIAPVLDAGTVDGVPFVARPLIEGLDVARLVEIAGPEGLSEEAAIYIVAEVARALTRAPREHSGVRPGNLLVSWTGEVTLLDYGTSLSPKVADRLALEKLLGALIGPERAAKTGELGPLLARDLGPGGLHAMQEHMARLNVITEPTGPRVRALNEMFEVELLAGAELEEEESGDPTVKKRPRKEDKLLGRLLHGYRLVERIGEGTFARVYRGHHEVLGRTAAIKVLREKYAALPEAVSRFRREAQALGGLEHPNVVRILDFGVTEENIPFLVMEYLEGRPLAEAIEIGQLSQETVLHYSMEILAGLEAAHRAGLIHRDLKSRNIVLVRGDDGREHAKVLDFGIARVVSPGAEDLTRLTHTDAVLGSPAYMAPEQIRGASNIGPGADLYSFGIILYEMISGERPFSGPVPEVISAHLTKAPPPLPDFGGLDKLAMLLLEKDPLQRPKSAGELLSLLTPAPVVKETNGRLVFAAVTGVVFLGISTGIFFSTGSKEQEVGPAKKEQAAPAKVPLVQARATEAEIVAAEPPALVPAEKIIEKKRVAKKVVEEAPAAAEKIELTEELLRARLARVSARLDVVATTYPKDQVEKLQSEYFDLRMSARPPLDRGRLELLRERLEKLESALGVSR